MIFWFLRKKCRPSLIINTIFTYLFVSAFTLVGLNRLPSKQWLIEEDTLGFD